MKKKSFTKKQIAVILAILLLCMTFCGCGKAELNGHEAKSYNVTVQGTIFGGAGDDQIKTVVSFDPLWVTSKSNKKYNKDLAAFAAILSDDVYFRTKDVERGTPNRVLYEGESAEKYDWTCFLKEVGFSEVQYIESYKAREYTGDSNDSATLLLAHGVVNDKYDLFVVSLRGCFSAQEWISVFDPGYAGESYTALTGQHSEWTDVSAYKGLDIAKNRAMEFIEEFITQNDHPDYQNCMLITGHSRGGALANMIGAEMEDRKDIRSYTYTFNAPGVTTNEKATEYQTIFNIFDENDFYTDPLPFAKEKFYRYGRDISLAIADFDEIKTEIAALKGRDDFISMDAKSKSEFAKLFGKRFPDRASLYTMTTVTQSFDNKEDALARAEACLQLIGSENGLGLESFCYLLGNDNYEPLFSEKANAEKAVIAADEGKYEVAMAYCGGAVLIAYAKTLAYGEATYQGTVQLFQEDKEACEILKLLMSNAAGLNGGHLLINSFVLSQHNTK